MAKKDKVLVTIGLLAGIPAAFWLVTQWFSFWIQRSAGEWMACGVGIPLATLFVFMLWSEKGGTRD